MYLLNFKNCLLARLSSGLFLFCSTFLVIMPGYARALGKEAGGVEFSGQLAQSTFVSSEDREAHLLVKITAPTEAQADSAPQPTELIVVLDTSGSMSSSDKLPKAKAALDFLIKQLNQNDSLAIISFSSGARTVLPLGLLSRELRAQAQQVVATLYAGGGTNMGSGLTLAQSLLTISRQNSTKYQKTSKKRVLLLSDGQANEGIYNLGGLMALSTNIENLEAVVSTIGMGLDFNPETLDSIARSGMGTYSYLEDLSALDRTFTSILDDSRQTYARESEIELVLGPGVSYLSSGSYPGQVAQGDSSRVIIKTGRLLQGATKDFFINLKLPNSWPDYQPLAAIKLSYTVNDHRMSAELAPTTVQARLVSASQVELAKASVQSDVWAKYWKEYELGNMYNAAAQALSSGNQQQATQAIANYRTTLNTKQGYSDTKLFDRGLLETLQALDQKIQDAFVGPVHEQKGKQKGLSLETFYNDVSIQE